MRPAALLVAALMCLAGSAAAERYAFGLIGDLPYNDYERQVLPRLIEESARLGAAFVVHVGDIKNGWSPCSDELFEDRVGLFRASRVPIVFVPGDNDWTDCRRLTAGSYDPAERLTRLRELFFGDAYALGEGRLAVERQSDDPQFSQYREHMRWARGKVLFVALNVPGGENGGRQAGIEFDRRRAVHAWIAGSFSLARRRGMRGVVVLIHANPGFEAANEGKPRPAYEALLAQLARETSTFRGQVLLAHGDTHRSRVDRPLLHPETRRALRNFIRVETHGSPLIGWTRVIVEDNSRFVFRVQPILYSPPRTE